MKSLLMALALAMTAAASAAGPLDGKRYIIEVTSSQFVSGYAEYLVPPLVEALEGAQMHFATNEEADVVVNIITDHDVGQWMRSGDDQTWIYTVDITVGISPVTYVIPDDGTPVYGVRARLLTPNPDREDELDCLIQLAARTAVANYGASGLLQTDGSSCLRQE